MCTLQVAAQQGKYLAKLMNHNLHLFPRRPARSARINQNTAIAGANNTTAATVSPPAPVTVTGSPPTNASQSAAMNSNASAQFGDAMYAAPKFEYTHLGSMANVGHWKGVIDTPNTRELRHCVTYCV
jgi:NADH dehydrogenase FAD-containing subunit